MYLVVDQTVNEYEIPKTFRGLPVERSWKFAGGKPKQIIIIQESIWKFVLGTNAYVLICRSTGCQCIGDRKEGSCRKHEGLCIPLKKKETYKYCRKEGCSTRACFGYEYKKSLYCAAHKQSDMYDVKHNSCQEVSCSTRPLFGYERRRPLYCANHKVYDMIDVVHERCLYQGCPTRPSFGVERYRPLFCSIHKHNDMFDVVSRTCLQSDCTTIPSFGKELGKPLYCFSHKTDDMFDVTSRKCVEPECNIRPTYNYEGSKPQYCTTHKKTGMIDVAHSKCSESGCSIGPSEDKCETLACYGYEAQDPQYCANHKKSGMINVCDTCSHPNCRIISSYAKLYYGSRNHCVEHSTLNEYSISKHKPVCSVLMCKNIAYFIGNNDINVYPVRCSLHKLPNDIELINRRCPGCNDQIYFPSNKHVCMECGQYRQRKLYRFKEQIMKAFLESNNIPFVYPMSKIRHCANIVLF